MKFKSTASAVSFRLGIEPDTFSMKENGNLCIFLTAFTMQVTAELLHELTMLCIMKNNLLCVGTTAISSVKSSRKTFLYDINYLCYGILFDRDVHHSIKENIGGII